MDNPPRFPGVPYPGAHSAPAKSERGRRGDVLLALYQHSSEKTNIGSLKKKAASCFLMPTHANRSRMAEGLHTSGIPFPRWPLRPLAARPRTRPKNIYALACIARTFDLKCAETGKTNCQRFGGKNEAS